jgi:FADH2-dependent halogenase
VQTQLDAAVVIVGAGPAGSASALYLLKQGVRPLIVEREAFPRYHIGESLTGECGNCLRELGLEDYMGRVRYPVKYGVTVWGAGGRNSFWVPVKRRGEDGALHDTTTWQVRRADFDRDLLDAAVRRGATLYRATAGQVIRDGDRVVGLTLIDEDEKPIELRTEVVLDASGQSTFLAQRGLTSTKLRGSYDRQVAVFSQAVGALRDPGEAEGNTLIFYQRKHHWAWFIPLSERLTSIGLVVPGELVRSSGLDLEAFFRREIVALNPELTRRLQDVEYVEPVRTASNYSYRADRFTGPGFLCVGDSHRFADPIFSFGVYLAMAEARFAAEAVARCLERTRPSMENPFAEYEQRVEGGQQIIQDLIDCFWEFPLAFQRMVHESHVDDITDCFAGRIYHDDGYTPPAVAGMRRLLAKRRALLHS